MEIQHSLSNNIKSNRMNKNILSLLKIKGDRNVLLLMLLCYFYFLSLLFIRIIRQNIDSISHQKSKSIMNFNHIIFFAIEFIDDFIYRLNNI